MKKLITVLLGTLLLTSLSQAQEVPNWLWSGFVDTYYSFDFNRPASREKELTTTASRHDEFNINMASMAVEGERGKLSARLAFHAGTSVERNYSGEPGTNSQSFLSRHLQEGWIKYLLSENLSLQAGPYGSHLGL